MPAIMLEIFKDLIREFHSGKIPEPSRRDIILPIVPQDVRKALVFIGMRRSGKTWTLYQIMHDLLSSGLDLTKILYLNFEDERISDTKKENLQEIIKAYFLLYPEYIGRSDVYFFFDEIHEIDGWEKFIRRLIDQEQVQLYLTGSSAKMLGKEIASSLRGRTLTTEIFPFSFTEMLQKKNVTVPRVIGGKAKLELLHHLEEFLLWGGFPEAIGATDDYRRQLLQGFIESVMYRDIVERYGINATHALRSLIMHCVRNSASVFSISKMYLSLKSQDYEIGKNTLYDYMDYFEDAYCIFSIPKYDLSLRKSAKAMKKIYAVDQGLITSVSMARNFDRASQLETAVFCYIRRQTDQVFYYKLEDDKEVDFAFITPDQELHLYQVCLTLADAKTRQREMSALSAAMAKLKLNKGTIVTFDEEEEVSIQEGIISIVPIWQLFLS